MSTGKGQFDNTPSAPVRHLTSQFNVRVYYCGALHNPHGGLETADTKRVTCKACLARLDRVMP